VAIAEFQSFTAGPLTKDGRFVVSANLTIGLGGVSAADDEGVWWFDGTSTSLLAREGSAGVPDVPGASFDSFSDLAIDTSGDVVLRASLTTGVGGVSANNNQAIWRYPGGVGSLLARTGSGNTPGVPGADFLSLPLTIQASTDGRIAFNGTLDNGSNVTDDNNKGVWSYAGSPGSLVVREGTPGVPGVGSATLISYGSPAINSSDQTLFIGSLKLGGAITVNNGLGLWQYTGTSGTLIARLGVGDVPDVGGANFLSIAHYTQNNLGQVAIHATLDVAQENGIWLYTGGLGTLLGRKGVGGVPGIVGANFETFDGLQLNDAGQLLVHADLEIGTAGVSASDNQGLWFLDGTGSLLLRTGSGGVPELPGANFLGFSSYSLNESGQLAVAATLEIDNGGVDSSNDSGLWLVDPNGISQLVAREGDSLAGHTIASLSFLADSAGNEGQLRGLNDHGQLLFQANFTDGDSGLFLFNPLAADFNFDGLVDSEDYLVWEAGFGTTSAASQMQGDSDDDQDVDGADFLRWQRQFGDGVPPPLVANTVPEPATWLLFSTGIVGYLLGFRRQIDNSSGGNIEFRSCMQVLGERQMKTYPSKPDASARDAADTGLGKP